VRRCLAGDRSAFDALYDRHSARVFNLLRRLTGDAAEAEDLTQETFVAAYRDLGTWREDGAFGTWLCGIAFHQYTAARRRARPETEPLDEEMEIAFSDADPLAHFLREERRRHIEEAITALPPIYREVFVLVQVEGLTYRQAATWLHVPLGTVQWRLWRAVRLLQSALSDLLEIPADRPSHPAPERKKPGKQDRAVLPESEARNQT
jgi:RNA polymerase sigma-70 factor (ECF subfamily)